MAKHLFGIALTWVLVLVGTFFLLRWYSQPSAEREVPVFGGACPKPKPKTLCRRWSLEAVWQDSIYAPSTGEPGAVVEQHPPAGSSVKAGRKILLTTFRITPPSERVGWRKGRMPRFAERLLSTRGFEVKVKEEPNSLLAGKVIRVERKGETRRTRRQLSPRDFTHAGGGCGGRQGRARALVDGPVFKDAMGVLNRRNLALGHVGYAADVVTALDTNLAVVVSQDATPAETLRQRRFSHRPLPWQTLNSDGHEKGHVDVGQSVGGFRLKNGPNQVRVVLALMVGLMLFGHESRLHRSMELDLERVFIPRTACQPFVLVQVEAPCLLWACPLWTISRGRVSQMRSGPVNDQAMGIEPSAKNVHTGVGSTDLGVRHLDGLDGMGNPYMLNEANPEGYADTLTSRRLLLGNNAPGDSVALCFGTKAAASPTVQMLEKTA